MSFLVAALLTPSARANVYATDIKLNGGTTSITNASGNPMNISFILNEPATMGTTINIFAGANVIRTLTFPSNSPGTLQGLNTVTWDGNATGGGGAPSGTYSISITPATSGFTNWTQTSTDTNAGYYVFSPRGIAVNNNTHSPYYGRVLVGNAANGPTSGGPGANPGDVDGILKVNADGSLADEGQGNTNGLQAGYHWMDDSFNDSPHFLRYGQDDRIYALDLTGPGIIIACDMIMSTNQVALSGANYANNPYNTEAARGGGWGIFDVTDAGTTNGRIWLGDYDEGGGGVWFWHMTNGVANPSDNVGTQAIAVGGDLSVWPAGGFMMDESSNIFVSQDPTFPGDANNLAMVFTNWSGTNTLTHGTGWRVGAGDPTFTGIYDTALDSRTRPNLVAYALSSGTGGLRVLSASNGATVLTNLDAGNSYYGVAWDAVGNLYGASASLSLWRAFSPPGTNQATTVALPTVQIAGSSSTVIMITSMAVSNGMVIINFTGPSGAATSAFTLLSSSGAKGSYSTVTSATITSTGSGTYQATAPVSGPSEFYRIKYTQSGVGPTRPNITSLAVTNNTITLNFTGSASDPPTAFTLLSSSAPGGAYVVVGSAAITQVSPGVFKATAGISAPLQFYRLKR
jgi:hypothetical protein